jgi:hypothetical protein
MKLDENLASGLWFKDRVDPTDDRYRLVEMRIPMEPSLRHNYGHEYIGRSVMQRIRRFAGVFLLATGDLTYAHSTRIVRAAEAAEDEVARG